MNRNLFNLINIGLGVFLCLLIMFNIVMHFHSPTKPIRQIVIIGVLIMFVPIHWTLILKYNIGALNKRLDALDDKLNRLLERQER